ncbi:hypothetical protein CEUSTIGMA_g11140.t1 [Chlamydomonas eustigma]|uniref:BZIP domain-containing protein n=1 Tax=Chlamydomonas eustigma TaxID=1157962 RepID=A0A250XKT9_9CHLO|nr:hypothetical protein CEUSTIGMA_g11140.t1 [Chlamydomonas eustigma]|eukprot:GAX83715.1 hypothetical protein CEUSTIGMA_g11140.t1 [Chlamydomonas eustigma]
MSGGPTGMGERIFSVDDLVGGIWRLGQAAGGFHRTDSEAAFQEFLKRIPSATNLAASGNQQETTSSAQQPVTQAPVAAPVPASIEINMNGGIGMGMQRIPSMDFLKQLSAMQQMSGAQAVKLEAPTPPPGMQPYQDLASLNASSMASLPGLNGLNGSFSSNAAAALQLNQMSRYTAVAATSNGRSAHTSDPDSCNDNEKDAYDKNDPRKAKRMLSNRESARRSRRRKQEHLGKLEMEISNLLEEKKAWTEQIASLEKRSSVATDENKRLKEENERLKDELLFLRSELKEKNAFARKGGRREQDDEVPEHVSKRSKQTAAEETAEITEDGENESS